jgi:hypothetical protein
MDQLSSDTHTTRIQALAQVIASQTAVVDRHLRDNNHPEPSFAADGPIEPLRESTPEVEKAKTSIIEATIELRQLLEGPVKALVPEVFHRHCSSTIRPPANCAAVQLCSSGGHIPVQNRVFRSEWGRYIVH